ncbi:MAG TPA: lytic murein transglycosylase [Candidatus Paceibacterota bacterium]|nr:lytic murein transglycosylase [Candidatus Paceibacterota bacterium]
MTVGLRGTLALFLLAASALMCAGAAYSLAVSAPLAHADELTPEQKAKLQAEYDQLQVEIAQWQKVLDDTRAKKGTLQGDVTLLDAQIKKAEAEIKQRTATITTLASEIQEKNARISSLEDSIEAGHESLAKLLRQKNDAETRSLVLLAFSSQSLSDFFSDVDSIDSIDRNLQDQFAELRDTRSETEKERAALDAKKNQELDAQHEVQAKKTAIANDQTQKKELLAVTATQEKTYAQVLAANQAKAAAIRAALFPLRDASAIQFGDALTYAQAAQKKTGVDPALVLAILTQESNLGTNVGQCYLVNDATGAGKGKNTGTPFAATMNPTRDVPPFLALSRQLGFDPHAQVVSCPIASAGGWGGAMGPAQFIPSTWAGLASRIAAARGVSVANPWDPQDAIAAMSIFLGDLGAGAGGYTAERTAAAKYYAGGAWATAGQTYATQVMAKVAQIQQNIDFLTNN